jgi:hypothetical protein
MPELAPCSQALRDYQRPTVIGRFWRDRRVAVGDMTVVTCRRMQQFSTSQRPTGSPSSPGSGQYERIGPRGGHTGEEVTGIKGRPMPPTPGPGSTYRIVDRTKNRSGQAK